MRFCVPMWDCMVHIVFYGARPLLTDDSCPLKSRFRWGNIKHVHRKITILLLSFCFVRVSASLLGDDLRYLCDFCSNCCTNTIDHKHVNWLGVLVGVLVYTALECLCLNCALYRASLALTFFDKTTRIIKCLSWNLCYCALLACHCFKIVLVSYVAVFVERAVVPCTKLCQLG